MNYIKELNAFRDWALINRPSTGQVALWYSLMSVNNMTGWKTEFTVPNQTLQLMTGLSRQGLANARNALMQAGLIKYEKGRSNQAGRYRMISLHERLFECQKVGTGVDAVVGTDVGTGGAHQLAQEGRTGCHSSSTLYKQKHKQKQNNIYVDFVEWFNKTFGTKCRPTTYRDKINARLKVYSLEQLKQACLNMRKNPHMMGQNDNGTIYATLEYITRNDRNVDKWLNYQEKGEGGYGKAPAHQKLEERMSDWEKQLYEN